MKMVLGLAQTNDGFFRSEKKVVMPVLTWQRASNKPNYNCVRLCLVKIYLLLIAALHVFIPCFYEATLVLITLIQKVSRF